MNHALQVVSAAKPLTFNGADSIPQDGEETHYYVKVDCGGLGAPDTFTARKIPGR
jgi:hypothetical protein